jgi:RHS repeat-associated protein
MNSRKFIDSGDCVTHGIWSGGDWFPFRTRTFVWDGWLPVLELADNAGGSPQAAEYFWGGDLSGSEQGAGGVGGLVAVSVDGQYYFPCYDHNGNVTAYVSESGSIAARYTYTPFGEVMSQSGPMAGQFRFRFSTKYQDAATGLYYYGYRVYDPQLMRFLNRDPVGEEGGLNLYGFVGNDPVNRIDSLGLAPQLCGIDAGGMPIYCDDPDPCWGHCPPGDGSSGRSCNDKITAVIALLHQYKAMRNANTKGADKYFHCLGFCEAAHASDSGWAVWLSSARETLDLIKNCVTGKNTLEDQLRDALADIEANRTGIDCPAEQSCESCCCKYKVKGL